LIFLSSLVLSHDLLEVSPGRRPPLPWVAAEKESPDLSTKNKPKRNDEDEIRQSNFKGRDAHLNLRVPAE